MSYPTVVAQSFNIDNNWKQLLIAAAVLLFVLLIVQRAVKARSQKVRRAAASAYYDPDVANYGSGPKGFAGAASARMADGTSLAPTFAASNPTRGGSAGGTPSPPVGPAMADAAPATAAPGSYGPPPTGPMFANQAPPPGPTGAPVATIPPPAPTPPGYQVPAGPAPAAAVPEGWLPDPYGAPDTVRYWNGSAWTEHTAQRS